MAKALDQSGDIAEDRGEPSWAALAHLVRETRFAQVYRRLNFLRYMLVVNAGDYWNEVLLDVAGHRYRPYLETFVVSPQEASRSFPEFIDSFDLTDIESTELPMIEVMVKSQRPKGTVAWTIAQCHDDETARDIAVSLGAASEQSRAILARDLFAISPHHPRARAVLIQTDWDQFKDQAATWEKESGDSPTVLAALYSRYFAEKRFEDARRVIEGYIKKSPDRWAYEQLAYVYKTQGMMDRWKSTLDDYLQNVEDLGLDHAQVRVGMAEYFMAKGEWSKARPYAEDAAETWAEWAMLCAGRCAEGEKDWDRAEEWFIRSAQRYTDSSWLRWYLFCNRTGHGNIEEARAFADQYIAAHAERTDLVWLKPEALAYYYWIDGRIAEAKAKFAEGFEKQGAVSALISLAMIADDERDKARRDQLLDEICTKHKAKAPLSIGVCQTLRDSILAPGGKKPVDRAALKQQIDSIPEAGRGYVQFFVGWFLKNNDDQELAKSYLKAAAADTKSNSFWHKSFSEKALKELSAK
jgi:Tfp pilus assembly protein PilF